MSEDPITGSLNSALAHGRLHKNELADNGLVAQGTNINLEGRVYISRGLTQGHVSIGGQTHILIEGSVYL